MVRGMIPVPSLHYGFLMRLHCPQNLAYLLSLSPTNHDTFAAINHAIFGLSLDPYTLVRSSRSQMTSHAQPDTDDEVDDHLHNLRSAHPDHPARNRWWDKPLTIIVESNTRAGAIGEHSVCDALIPSIVTEYAIVQGVDDDAFGGPVALGSFDDALVSNASSVGWRRLDWVADKHIEEECVAAEKRAKHIADDSDDSLLPFSEFGAVWIKNIGE